MSRKKRTNSLFNFDKLEIDEWNRRVLKHPFGSKRAANDFDGIDKPLEGKLGRLLLELARCAYAGTNFG